MLGGWAVTHAGCLGHASFTPIPHPPSSPCPPSPLTCSRSLCQRQATSATGRGTLPSCARSACPTCSVHGPWRPGSVGRGGAGGGTASSSLSMAWLQQGRVEAVKQVEQQRASRHEEQTRSSVSASGQAVIGLLSSTTGLPPAPPSGDLPAASVATITQHCVPSKHTGSQSLAANNPGVSDGPSHVSQQTTTCGKPGCLPVHMNHAHAQNTQAASALTLVVPDCVAVPPQLLPGGVQLQKLDRQGRDTDVNIFCPGYDGVVAHRTQASAKHGKVLVLRAGCGWVGGHAGRQHARSVSFLWASPSSPRSSRSEPGRAPPSLPPTHSAG